MVSWNSSIPDRRIAVNSHCVQFNAAVFFLTFCLTIETIAAIALACGVAS
jgi:hypothetical protein